MATSEPAEISTTLTDVNSDGRRHQQLSLKLDADHLLSTAHLPPSKLARVIVNTDAKNEADHQYAIVHALLKPMFELHGIVPAHFGAKKSKTSLQDSHDEVMRVPSLLDLAGKVKVADGALGPMPDERTAMPSDGARLIVEERPTSGRCTWPSSGR